MGVVLTKHDNTGDTWPVKGEYRPVTYRGRRSAVIACPSCGVTGSLNASHRIDTDGSVKPSIVCDCGFHDRVFMEDWRGA